MDSPGSSSRIISYNFPSKMCNFHRFFFRFSGCFQFHGSIPQAFRKRPDQARMLPCNARVVLKNYFAKFKGGRIAKAVYNIRNCNCSKLTQKIQEFFHRHQVVTPAILGSLSQLSLILPSKRAFLPIISKVLIPLVGVIHPGTHL